MRRPGFIEILLAPEGGSAGAGASTSAPSGGAGPSGGAPSSGAPSSAPSSHPNITPTSTPVTPAPSPSPAPSSTPAPGEGVSVGEGPSVSQEAFDFGTLFGEDPFVTPAPSPPPAAPQVPPAPPPQAVVQQPEVVAQPVASPSPVGTPQEPSPQQVLSPAEPQKIADALMANEPAILDHVAKTLFALSPEDVEGLETNAAEMVPKLMARSFVKAQHNMLTQMGKIIPAMIQRHNAVNKAHLESEGKFYDRWKDTGLSKAKHQGIVDKYAQLYRKANPSASLEQMIEDLGPMVVMAAKIPPASAQPNGSVGVSPMARRPTSPQPTPFVPAIGSPGVGNLNQEEGDQPWLILDPERQQ